MLSKLLVALAATTSLAACSSSSNAPSGSPLGKVPDGGGTIDSGTVQTVKVDRSGLTDLGKDPLDYSNPNLWLCRPGNDPNECYVDLTATEIKKDMTTATDPRPPTTKPKFDCFYVYPTVALSGGGNVTDYHDISATLDPLLSQAAPFNALCEVYAPLYRQTPLSAGGGPGDGGVAFTGDTGLAYSDVEAAFEYFLGNLSHGRKFVLLGHSQGSLMLTELIQKKIDNDPALRARMISALLIGGFVTVPQGKDVGGSFQNVPACTTPGQNGCVVAYNSFAAEAPPPANAVFGKTGDPATEVLCTTPGPLANNTGNYLGSYQPTNYNVALFKPDGAFPITITTPFGLYRDFFKGECVRKNGFHYMEVSINKSADDQRPTPPYRSNVIESVGFGLHVADYNLATDDLLKIVQLQTASL